VGFADVCVVRKPEGVEINLDSTASLGKERERWVVENSDVCRRFRVVGGGKVRCNTYKDAVFGRVGD